jgi:hypothetical protein
MSAVFMCDRGGELFSANEKGWKELSEVWDGDPATNQEFNNSWNHGKKVLHLCPKCAQPVVNIAPRLALEEASTKVDDNA